MGGKELDMLWGGKAERDSYIGIGIWLLHRM